MSLTGEESTLQARTDPAAEVETEQAFEELGRSLQQLSPKAYATLILSRCEGLPLKQIGERLQPAAAPVVGRRLAVCKHRRIAGRALPAYTTTN